MRFPALPLPLSLARAVLGARRRVLDLADTGLPGQAALFLDVVFGLQKTKIAGLLVSSGLADALGKASRDPVELAHELGLDPDVTIRIVNAAAALRLMQLDRHGRVRLTKVGAPLRRKHPKSIASWAAYYADPRHRSGICAPRRPAARRRPNVRIPAGIRQATMGLLRRSPRHGSRVRRGNG